MIHFLLILIRLYQKNLIREENVRITRHFSELEQIFSFLFLSSCTRRKKVVCVLKSFTPRPDMSAPGSPVLSERAPLAEHAMRLPHSSPTLQRGEILIEWKDGTVTPLYEAWGACSVGVNLHVLVLVREHWHLVRACCSFERRKKNQKRENEVQQSIAKTGFLFLVNNQRNLNCFIKVNLYRSYRTLSLRHRLIIFLR